MKYYKWMVAALASLLVGSWLLLYHYYSQSMQKKTQPHTSFTRVVIAAKDIAKHTKITKNDLRYIEVKKSKAPLTQPSITSIVGKYAKASIPKGSIITASMLATTIAKKTQKPKQKMPKAQQHLQGAALPMRSFQNFDIPLQKGAHIDIVSIVLHNQKPLAKYVATDVKIVGFVQGSRIVQKSVSFLRTNPKAPPKRVVADYILLDLAPKKILDVLQREYRSLQLNTKRIYTLFHTRHAHLWIVPAGKKVKLEFATKRKKIKKEVMKIIYEK